MRRGLRRHFCSGLGAATSLRIDSRETCGILWQDILHDITQGDFGFRGYAMTLNDLLFGRPLRTSEEAGEKLGPVGGLSVFGLDALSSAGYGPEAALTLLIPLAAAGIAYIVPISASIVILLAIVYFSYRQTIAAYPSGGGSYTVAREILGEFSVLLRPLPL